MAPQALAAQHQGGAAPASAASVIDTLAIDACGIARVDQLRFLIAAGIGRYFPVARGMPENARLEVSDPVVTSATCSPLKATIGVRLKLERVASAERDSAVGTARLSAEMSATAAFAVADAKAASRPGSETVTPPTAVRDASLCFRDVRVLGVDVTPRSPRLEGEALGAWLTEALGARGCYDVTSLVYVYLQRGGRLHLAR